MGTQGAIKVISSWQVFKALVFPRVSYPFGQGIPAAFLLAVINLFSACDEEGGPPVVPDHPSPGTVTGFSAKAGDTQISLSWVNPTDSEPTGDLILPRDNDVILTGPALCWSLESLWKGCGVELWNEHFSAIPQSFA